MKVSVDENRNILLEEIFTGVILKTRDGEQLGICMRDSGFEFTYQGKSYSAQKGRVWENKVKPTSSDDSEPTSNGQS